MRLALRTVALGNRRGGLAVHRHDGIDDHVVTHVDAPAQQVFVEVRLGAWIDHQEQRATAGQVALEGLPLVVEEAARWTRDDERIGVLRHLGGRRQQQRLDGVGFVPERRCRPGEARLAFGRRGVLLESRFGLRIVAGSDPPLVVTFEEVDLPRTLAGQLEERVRNLGFADLTDFDFGVSPLDHHEIAPEIHGVDFVGLDEIRALIRVDEADDHSLAGVAIAFEQIPP